MFTHKIFTDSQTTELRILANDSESVNDGVPRLEQVILDLNSQTPNNGVVL